MEICADAFCGAIHEIELKTRDRIKILIVVFMILFCDYFLINTLDGVAFIKVEGLCLGKCYTTM